MLIYCFKGIHVKIVFALMILELRKVGGQTVYLGKRCHEGKNKKNAFKYFEINKKKRFLRYKESSAFSCAIHCTNKGFIYLHTKFVKIKMHFE